MTFAAEVVEFYHAERSSNTWWRMFVGVSCWAKFIRHFGQESGEYSNHWCSMLHRCTTRRQFRLVALENPMVKLELLEANWIGLFDELRHTAEIKDQIAAPFLSIPPTEARSVLYVGKATAQDWYRDDTAFGCPCNGDSNALRARLQERHEVTREFIANVAPTYNSGFWQFARELNAVAARRWKVPLSNCLQHITWTNICKVGALTGNPSGSLFNKQRDLAIETLRQEIESYKPQLIYFATWNYAWVLVKEVFGDLSDERWDQSGNGERIWLRQRTDGIPPVILTGHPERKTREIRVKWLNKVSELLPD